MGVVSGMRHRTAGVAAANERLTKRACNQAHNGSGTCFAETHGAQDKGMGLYPLRQGYLLHQD